MCSLYGTAYKFSKSFFDGWVVVSLLWAIFAFSSVTIYPIIEGRHLLWAWTKAAIGKGGRTTEGDEFNHHEHRQRGDEEAISSGTSANGDKVTPVVGEKATPLIGEAKV
jgi:urea-proton symporter